MLVKIAWHMLKNEQNNIFPDLVGISGMTAFIIIRIQGINTVLQIVLAIIYSMACVFFTILSIKSTKGKKLAFGKSMQLLHYTLCTSYLTILILLSI